MPKDATKNVDRYKIRGGQLNEFDFHQNQEDFAEQPKARAANLIPGTPPEAKKTSKATKGTKSTKARSTKKAPTGASAKKLAARKATKKKSTKKRTTKKK